ncbi:hypothetical protein [Phenylobacterium sp.]|uniref:hypothetical protein n=1 Tax=Phenylobacterium sp. TaxID=1871053 RepID=UPI00301C8978
MRLPARRFIALFGVLSLAAVATGCAVAAASGVPWPVWVRNPAAWFLGAVLAGPILAFARRRALVGFLVAAPVGLAASLLGPGQQGVHRWLDVGAAQLNAAEIALPPAIVALAVLGRDRAWPWLAAAVVMALLIAQPDASQATAFGVALMAVIATVRRSYPARAAAMGLLGVAVAVSWLRLDTLAPVPEVEEIMRLAWAISPLVAVVAWVALLGATASLALARTRQTAAALALASYAVSTALVPEVGHFPVPLVGIAVSPILGLWLGAAVVAAQGRQCAYPGGIGRLRSR